MPGSAVYSNRYRDWLTRTRALLIGQGVPKENIVVISGDERFNDEFVTRPATREAILAAVAAAGDRAKPEDQFVLVLAGHGIVTDDPPKFVVKGVDLNAEELGAALETIRAENQVVVNYSASAGAFVKSLASSGRVTVAANSPTEGVEPVFAEFFLRGIESKRADGYAAPEAGRKDGTVTVLEAYNWATWHTAQWIARQNYVMEGGAWQLNGRESTEIFEKLCAGPRGAMGARRLTDSSDRQADDARVLLRPEGAEIPPSWETRRIVTEHASLEDCGEEIPVSALVPAELAAAMGAMGDAEQVAQKEFAALAGRAEGQPGYRARRVVLGRAELRAE